MEATPREQWSGRTAFVLATVASAVGLGNIWRFAYVAGENGGGAFLLAYSRRACARGPGAGCCIGSCRRCSQQSSPAAR